MLYMPWPRYKNYNNFLDWVAFTNVLFQNFVNLAALFAKKLKNEESFMKTVDIL